MKNSIFLIFLFLGSACNNLGIEFKDEQLPVFYVYAENGQSAKAYIGESFYTDRADIPETDTLQLELKMYKNSEFLEFLHATDMYYIDNEDTIIDSEKIAYRSSSIIESGEAYSFTLNYKNYPELTLSTEIPPPAQIDSFHVEPNIALTRSDRYILHNFKIFFTPHSETHYHYFFAIYMDHSNTVNVNGTELNSAFVIDKKHLKDDEIIRGEPNSVNFTIASPGVSGYFTPTVFLMTISDDYYNYLLDLHAYEEFKQNAGFFNRIPAHTPYSMIPNAFANVFAYSTAKKSGDSIQITLPVTTE
jgi:hypothetical protein